MFKKFLQCLVFIQVISLPLVVNAGDKNLDGTFEADDFGAAASQKPQKHSNPSGSKNPTQVKRSKSNTLDVNADQEEAKGRSGRYGGGKVLNGLSVDHLNIAIEWQ